MKVTSSAVVADGSNLQGPRLHFRVFLLSRAASALGDQLLLFAAPLIVYRATGSVTMSGLAFMIEWIPRLISLPLAGMLADRFGSLRVYWLADTVRALACVAAVLMLGFLPGNAFVITAVLMSVCAFCYAQSFVSLESTVAQLLSKQEIPRAQSLLQGIDQSAAVAGPALAGLLIFWWPPGQLLWIVGAVFAASATGVLAVRGVLGSSVAVAADDCVAARATRLGLVAGMQAAVSVLSRHRILLALVALSMAVNLITGMAMATGAAVTAGAFNQPDASFARLQATVGILSVVVLALLPWALRHLSVYVLGMGAFWMASLGAVIMAWSPSFEWFVLGYAIAIASCGPFNVFIRTERLNWIPKEQLGRVISAIIFLNQLSLPMAGLIVACMGTDISPRGLYALAACIALLVYAVVWRRIRRDALTARACAPTH